MHDCFAVLANWRFGRASGLLLVGASLHAAGGCLSLGGKTTYVQGTPESEARICGLETRVNALEQALATRSAASMPYETGEAVIGEPVTPLPLNGPAKGRDGSANR